MTFPKNQEKDAGHEWHSAPAQQLATAEAERLKQGATDLLALQIREQASFDAKVLEVEAQSEYFRAHANYRAAIAADK